MGSGFAPAGADGDGCHSKNYSPNVKSPQEMKQLTASAKFSRKLPSIEHSDRVKRGARAGLLTPMAGLLPTFPTVACPPVAGAVPILAIDVTKP